MRARQRPLVNRRPARVHGSGPVRRSGGSATRYPLGGAGREGLRVKRVRRHLLEPPGGREGAGPLSRSEEGGGGAGGGWWGAAGAAGGGQVPPPSRGAPSPGWFFLLSQSRGIGLPVAGEDGPLRGAGAECLLGAPCLPPGCFLFCKLPGRCVWRETCRPRASYSCTVKGPQLGYAP